MLSVPPTFIALPRSIVVAVDFGPSSVRAAQAALLVAAYGGTVTLTHVVPRPVRFAPLNMVPDVDLAINVHALFDHFREEIASSVPDGVNVETHLINGDAVDGILSSVAHVGADFIGIGTNGAGKFARLILGSVAEAVLHGADVPVLASPPPRAEEALELWRRVTGVARSDREQDWAAAPDVFATQMPADPHANRSRS